MRDPRLTRLAELLVTHSCRLMPGETIIIEAYDLPESTLVTELIRLVREAGGKPVIWWKSTQVQRAILLYNDEDSMTFAGSMEIHAMSQAAAYIGIRGTENSSQNADVPHTQMDLYQKVWWQKVHSEIRVANTKWVVLRYPTPSMAQSAKMSTEAFEDFYFDVCTADYAQMARDQEPLVKRMEEAKQVRIVSPGTDLSFSIEGIPVRPCHGQRNIPDGEVFTAPIKTSVEGTIRYNAPSLYQGTVFENIEFTFEKGKIVSAKAGPNTDKLNAILDSDEGARYIGEWSMGCNNRVKHPMLDTLFDEKIGGSLHFTPGNAYDDCDNGNRSRVHWDLVLIQTPEYGGGQIYFDGELLRQDGKFLPLDLQPLNVGL
ncbi:MAG TPA: aminopeptidase [Pirellulales bacterium]